VTPTATVTATGEKRPTSTKTPVVTGTPKPGGKTGGGPPPEDFTWMLYLGLAGLAVSLLGSAALIPAWRLRRRLR
jgi:hypothetical protein